MSLQEIFTARARLHGDVPASFRSVLERLRALPAGRAILNHRVWFIALFQACLVLLGLVTAWLLRFNFHLPNARILLSVAPVLIAVRMASMTGCGQMHGWWRYTGLNDAVAIVKATVIGSFVFALIVRFALAGIAYPRSLYFSEPLVSILLLASVRVVSRIVAEALPRKTFSYKNVILIGAGAAAQETLRAIARPGSGYRAIGCVDDDSSKVGIKILGVPVLGAVRQLPKLARQSGVKEVLIAVPSATPEQSRRFAEICAEAQVGFKAVPSLLKFLNGALDLSCLLEPNLEDLLGREPVSIDLESVRRQIEGRTILVTGAAGTIGSELCRQALQFHPAKLLCLDRNETGVFYLQGELQGRSRESQVEFFVSDFGDRERMRRLLGDHGPDVIFHAAAYKHVPMMENNVYDAVKNNVFGLLELLEVAEHNDCPSFVLISSDKAVNPANIMGATKRVGERLIDCRPSSMRCVSVRFGNVLGSNGSVVPILQKQLREHQQLTITHPDVTRFFMTTREAVSLVLEALAIGNHGDTLLLEMGSPMRILDLAKTLIRMSGRSLPEVEIQFTGLRAGEKLFEALSYPTEKILPTSFPKIGRIRGTPDGWAVLCRQLRELRLVMSARSDAAIRDMVKEIVPEYSPKVGSGAARQSKQAAEKVPQSVIPSEARNLSCF